MLCLDFLETTEKEKERIISKGIVCNCNSMIYMIFSAGSELKKLIISNFVALLGRQIDKIEFRNMF